MADCKKVLTSACAEAGKVLMRHLGNLEEIESKGSLCDVVTVADKKAEEVIVGMIRSSFPSHGILAEESGGMNEDSEYVWIIDPLDGTMNYSHTFPFFCVSVALEHHKEIVMGGIYAPVLDEFFFAERGRGATMNGDAISVSQIDVPERSLVITGFPHDIRERIDEYMSDLKKVIMATQGVLRVGSAALDLCSVACGRADAYYEEGIFAWDVAAGAIIIKEAGGKITDFSNNPFSPYAKQFIASNGLIHDRLVDLLRK